MFHFMIVEVLPAAVFLLPLYGLLHGLYFRNIRKTTLCFLFSFYLCAVYALVGLPNITYIRFDFSGNLIPFRGMLNGLRSTLLNIVLFVPLGIFLPLLRKQYRKWTGTALFGFCMSFVIEGLQIFTYRATDVNDLITNTAGTVLGWCIFHVFFRKIPSCGNRRLDLLLPMVLSLGVMFFLQPMAVALF